MRVSDLNMLLVQLLQQKNYNNCRIIYNSANEFRQGLLYNMTFVKVSCETENGEKQDLHLAVKKSTDNDIFRDALAIPMIYVQEFYFYDTVLPALMEFQSRKDVNNRFNCIPQYYGTFIKDKIELIVLDDLKDKGFMMFDWRKPLDLNHLKLTLLEYGRFHALSLAMNDQEPKTFRDVQMNNMIANHINRGMHFLIPQLFQQILDAIMRRGEHVLYEDMKSFLDKNNILQQTINLMEEETSFAVINHCDAWLKNFLFKYKVSQYRFIQ